MEEEPRVLKYQYFMCWFTKVTQLFSSEFLILDLRMRRSWRGESSGGLGCWRTRQHLVVRHVGTDQLVVAHLMEASGWFLLVQWTLRFTSVHVWGWQHQAAPAEKSSVLIETQWGGLIDLLLFNFSSSRDSFRVKTSPGYLLNFI